MKVITETVYIATDGKRFLTQEKCEQYEADGCVELSPLPDYGDHETLAEGLKNYFFTNGDGSCYYATETKMSKQSLNHNGPHPAWATHLIYFGK